MNISKICEKYNIESTELEEIKNELKQILKKVHPDNNSGEVDVESFDEIMNALEIINQEIKYGSTKNEIQTITEAFGNIIEKLNLSNELSEKKEIERRYEKLENDIDRYSSPIIRRTRVRRYTSASITAIITFLWLLPDKVLSHPFFKFMIENKIFSEVRFTASFFVIWIYMLVFTLFYWWRVFRVENQEKEILSNIKNKTIQNRMMMDFIVRLSHDGTLQFSRNQFLEYILDELGEGYGSVGLLCQRKKRKFYIENSSSQEIIENVTDIILLNAEKHKVIKKVEMKSLIEYYSIIEE